ncbi:MAG: hypothetical protein ACXVCO_09265 [Ktedonobacterales bacterium]
MSQNSMSQPTAATTAATHASVPGMPLWAQWGLTAAGMLALVVLLAAIALQVAATQPASTPAKVVSVDTGPYPLTVSLSRDPAQAGYALPFTIAPAQPVNGRLTYTVSAVPGVGVDATPVTASLTPDAKVANHVSGTVEITVRGPWTLHIEVDGPAGLGTGDVPLTAQAAGVMPGWIAWAIGLVPVIGIALYVRAQRRPAVMR